jgi:hypothetical protein
VPNLTLTALQVHRNWLDAPALLPAVRRCFAYAGTENRATGCLYAPADGISWPGPLATAGPGLLGDLAETTGIRYAICAFQAYRDGAGTDWHADTPFGAQAILSLGVTRTFGVRPIGGEPEWHTVTHGDLAVMPDGFQQHWEHCVRADDSLGERVALVFRTPAQEG